MWLYKDKEINSIDDMPADTFGFVYLVTHTPSGKKYLGKKQLISNRTLPPLKGSKRKRKIQKESDWKTYYGSHHFIKEEIKKGNQSTFKREIIQCAFSKKELTYLENKVLFTLAVLESKDYLNDNIEGRYFKKDFDL